MEQPLKMNLQFFADEDTTENEDVETTENEKEDEQENTTFTQSDVDREVSKAVDKALKKRDAKHQEDMQKAIDEALAEKERLSKLSEKERKEEEMTQKEKKLAEKEAEINRRILRSDAVDTLQKKGLPSDFADILLGEDAESTLENINNFKKTFDEAVNAAVKEKLRQDTPPAGGGGGKPSNVPSVAKLAEEHRLIK